MSSETREPVIPAVVRRTIERSVAEIIPLAGDASFAAIEDAYLGRDWPDDLSPDQNTEWTLSAVLSTALLGPVLDLTDADASDAELEPERIDGEVLLAVRQIVQDAVAELRAVVADHHDEAIAIDRASDQWLVDGPGWEPVLRTTTWLFCNHYIAGQSHRSDS